IDVATYLLHFNGCWSNRAPQFLDVIRGDGFASVVQGERARQIQSLGGAARSLIEIVFFLQKRGGRNIFEKDAVLLQPYSLFVWIQPIARRAQREPAFDHAGNKDDAKSQAAHIGCSHYAEAVAILPANRKRL